MYRRDFVRKLGLGLVGLPLVAGCSNDGAATNGTTSGSTGTGAGTGAAGGATADRPHVAFVTNGIADFWRVAEKGVQAGGKEFNADVEVIMPANGVEDQNRELQALLVKGVDGISISPINPENQTEILNEAAAATKLITQDSDAPRSNRLCYVGMDNYVAGKLCGQLVKEAIPNGGEVMIFVGRLGQDNARLRRAGVVDELLGRERDDSREDPSGELKGDKYTILDTRTDEFDFAQAKSKAQDAITGYPNLACMVGLFAYNPPKILESVREAGKIGQIQIVGFDEDNDTLQGVLDGAIHGTVVQNPYEYGRRSVEVLVGLINGKKDVVPEGGFIDIPARQIRKENVQEFWDDLKKKTGALDAAPATT